MQVRAQPCISAAPPAPPLNLTCLCARRTRVPRSRRLSLLVPPWRYASCSCWSGELRCLHPNQGAAFQHVACSGADIARLNVEPSMQLWLQWSHQPTKPLPAIGLHISMLLLLCLPSIQVCHCRVHLPWGPPGHARLSHGALLLTPAGAAGRRGERG